MGDDASKVEAASSRVGRDEHRYSEARRANTTPNGGPHLELGRLRLETWSKSDFSIAETTWPTYLYLHIPGICEILVLLRSYLLVRAPFAQPLKRSTEEGRPNTAVEIWARSVQCVARGVRSKFFAGSG